ncbi:MAG: hypothetical protein NVS3B1_19590 [Marmoricola sp.]
MGEGGTRQRQGASDSECREAGTIRLRNGVRPPGSSRDETTIDDRAEPRPADGIHHFGMGGYATKTRQRNDSPHTYEGARSVVWLHSAIHRCERAGSSAV